MRDVVKEPHTGQAVGVCGWRGGFTEATVSAVERHTNHLGGRWVTMTLTLPDGEVVTGVDSRMHVLLGPEYHETRWCPECRRTREVEDKAEDSYYSGPHEHGVFWWALECGHTVHVETGIIGASPGGESAAEATRQAATQRRLARQHAYDNGEW